MLIPVKDKYSTIYLIVVISADLREKQNASLRMTE